MQCLNEPEGVKELTGFANVFDVYVAQYHKTGVAESQKKGAEVWLATCCYPMDHPNFFLEYPLLDVRVTPWICWKYKAQGVGILVDERLGRQLAEERREVAQGPVGCKHVRAVQRGRIPDVPWRRT